jgi:hypothetical protein
MRIEEGLFGECKEGEKRVIEYDQSTFHNYVEMSQ